jgi:hypothetical protein
MTSSADIAMFFRSANTSPTFWVFADNRPVTPSAVSYTSNVAPGSLSYFRMTFSAASLRRIRIYMQYADFGGIVVAGGTSITAAVSQNAVRGAFLGDSWFGGAYTAIWPHTIPAIIAQTLGWEFMDCGIGGTGYVASGLPYTSATRAAPLYAVAPNYVVIGGSLNDNPSAVSVQAAAAGLYAAIGTNLPSAKIFVVGPQPAPSGYQTSPTLLANRDAVKAAALAAPNVLGFIDPIQREWFTGTGSVTSPVNDGTNKDYYIASDYLHPTRAGAYRYARLVIEDIVRLADKANAVI